MDNIAQKLFDALTETDETSMRELVESMREYETKYGRSLNNLKRIPGFLKLWDAMEEAGQFVAALTESENSMV